ncbi:MAG: hypothetical protein ABI865_10105 [Nitrosospira sp.]
MTLTYWTDEDIALLRDLWKTGILPEAMAEQLNKTVPDVLKKAAELRLWEGRSSGG